MRQTDYVILGLLSEAPLTGYQIKKIIELRFRFFWNESYGQLYPALKKLCEQHWIEEIQVECKHKRAQKTYQILREGMSALQQWLEDSVERESIRLEILLKMYFSHLTDPNVMIRHIAQFQEAHEQDLQVLKLVEKELASIMDKDPNHPYVLQVIHFGQKVNEAYLNWSHDTIKFLEGMTNK